MRDDYKSRKIFYLQDAASFFLFCPLFFFAEAQILRVLSLYFVAGNHTVFWIYVINLMLFNGKRELKRATSRDLITFGGKRELKAATSRS